MQAGQVREAIKKHSTTWDAISLEEGLNFLYIITKFYLWIEN